MKPFSKLIGWIALAGQVADAGAAIVGMLPPKYAAVVAAILAGVQAVSHSLNGTGGQLVR